MIFIAAIGLSPYSRPPIADTLARPRPRVIDGFCYTLRCCRVRSHEAHCALTAVTRIVSRFLPGRLSGIKQVCIHTGFERHTFK